MARKTGFFFRALPDSGKVDARIGPDGQIRLGFPNCFIPSPRIEKLLSAATTPLFHPLPRGAKLTLPPGAWMVNFCADGDEYAGAMAYLGGLLRDTGMPCFNPPEGVMNSRRDRVAALAEGTPHLTVPRCVRFAPKLPADFEATFADHGFAYPVLVRPAASQSGTHLVKIDSAADWDKVHTIPWGGRTLFMTQFVDFAGEDGSYLKIRAVCAGDRIVIRHTLFGSDWIVHAMDRTPEVTDREFDTHAALYANPAFTAVVREVKARLGLDFFGIDMGMIAPDRFVLFEANAAMSILSRAHMPEYRRADYERILTNVEEAVIAALRAVEARARKAAK